MTRAAATQGRCGPGPKLMLASAPAGFGEMTLLARTGYEYVAEQGTDAALGGLEPPSGPATPIGDDDEDGETVWRDTRARPARCMT